MIAKQRYLVIGENGRFARSFIQTIPTQQLVSSVSFSNFMQDSFLQSFYRFFSQSDVILWTCGPGQSKEIAGNLELIGLQRIWNILSIQNRARVHFVYLSSGGALYPTSLSSQDEDAAIIPSTIYGQQKWECERFIRETLADKVRSATIFRIANAYSLPLETRTPKGLIENAYFAGINQVSLPIWVDPNSRRQYAAHLDYARNILLALQPIHQLNPRGILTINLAPNFSYSVEEIVKEISHWFPNELRIDFQKTHLQDTVHLTSSKIDLKMFSWNRLEQP